MRRRIEGLTSRLAVLFIKFDFLFYFIKSLNFVLLNRTRLQLRLILIPLKYFFYSLLFKLKICIAFLNSFLINLLRISSFCISAFLQKYLFNFFHIDFNLFLNISL